MRGRGETRIIAVIVSGVPQTSHSTQLVGAARQFPAADWQASERKERHSLTPLSSGKHLLSHSHTRKARPAHRRRELTLTSSHLCSAHLDSCPLHRDASDPTGSPLLGPHVIWAMITPWKENHTSPCSPPWAAFRPPGRKRDPGKKEAFEQIYLDSYPPTLKLGARQRNTHIREQRRHLGLNLNSTMYEFQLLCFRCVPLL